MEITLAMLKKLPEKYHKYFNIVENPIVQYEPKVSGFERELGCDELSIKKFGQSGGANKALDKGEEEYLQDHIGLNRIKELRNDHPTLKPISLNYRIMQLFKLPEEVGQKVYVPFSGSGSEIIGTFFAGIKPKNIFACELNEKYVEISKLRISYWFSLFTQGYSLKDIKENGNKIKETEAKKKEIHKLF